MDVDTDTYRRVDYSPARLLNKMFTIKSFGDEKFRAGFDQVKDRKKECCPKCGSTNFLRVYGAPPTKDYPKGYSKAYDLKANHSRCRTCNHTGANKEWSIDRQSVASVYGAEGKG